MYITNKLHEMYLDWKYSDDMYELPMNLCFSMRHNNHLFVVYYDGRPIQKNSCFGIYDGPGWHISTKYAKISFLKPEYGFRPHIFSLFEWDRWYLNKDEKEELMDFLQSKNDYNEKQTNWEHLIDVYNGNHYFGSIKYDNIKLPNGRLPYPDYLPEDLSMPNYRLLPEKRCWF